MKTKKVLCQADVEAIGRAAAAEAQGKGWAVTVAVVDDGAHALWLQRLDGATPLTSIIALEKARAAALGRRESKRFEEMVNQGRTAFLSVSLPGLLEGGVPIVVDGDVVGAVGVSGVQSHEDAQVARAGIAALGLPPA